MCFSSSCVCDPPLRLWLSAAGYICRVVLCYCWLLVCYCLLPSLSCSSHFVILIFCYCVCLNPKRKSGVKLDFGLVWLGLHRLFFHLFSVIWCPYLILCFMDWFYVLCCYIAPPADATTAVNCHLLLTIPCYSSLQFTSPLTIDLWPSLRRYHFEFSYCNVTFSTLYDQSELIVYIIIPWPPLSFITSCFVFFYCCFTYTISELSHSLIYRNYIYFLWSCNKAFSMQSSSALLRFLPHSASKTSFELYHKPSRVYLSSSPSLLRLAWLITSASQCGRRGKMQWAVVAEEVTRRHH